MVSKELLNNLDKRYLLFGGKGGVGKTSNAAAFAVTFAMNGQKTLIISTDPAHSLSDSFNQNLSGGEIIKVEGIDNLWAMEINPEQAGNDFKSVAGLDDDPESVDEIMNTLNSLGMNEVGNLFETMPPGVDEALALAKVVQFIEDEKYSDIQRIIFDTAPTGHTLRLLQLPMFLDSFIGKLYRLRVKMSNATAAFKALLGMEAQRDPSLEIMDRLKEQMVKVEELFKNKTTTEFFIVTIPTIMAANESERLADQLKQNEIPVNNIIINQIMPENPSCKFCNARHKNQVDNLAYLRNVFSEYMITEVEFFDHEIRGIDALKELSTKLFK